MTSEKKYLGDGVYYRTDASDQVVLTVENGAAVLHAIYLNTECVAALLRQLARKYDKATLCEVIERA